MSSVLELGEFFLRHLSANCKLQASLSVRASIYSDLGNVAQNSLTAALLTSDSTWVCRGYGLRLDIDLSTGPIADEDRPTLAHFYEVLDASLRDTEECGHPSPEIIG